MTYIPTIYGFKIFGHKGSAFEYKYDNNGSHINNMHKDLTISLHTASTAMQIFHAGKTKYPNGDNWVCTRVIEDIIGAELHR